MCKAHRLLIPMVVFIYKFYCIVFPCSDSPQHKVCVPDICYVYSKSSYMHNGHGKHQSKLLATGVHMKYRNASTNAVPI